ncbi:MAG: SDR family oxidoreductase [Candidatus Kapaibacteriota bacterium]|jgi:3-oxoacyl-[acyl-carrier protein] reductase
MQISLENRKAIVCGATQGIGKSIAEIFVECGASVTIIARSEEKLISTKAELQSKIISENQTIDYIVVDFDNPEDLKTKLCDYQNNTKFADILINNTGGPNAGAAHKAGLDEFEIAFRRHLICNQILVQSVVEGMKQNHFGRIINIISTSVKQPLDNLGVSNTIRGAVANWAKTLSNELGFYNITVNNILPGATNTERLTNIIKNKSAKSNVTVDLITYDMKKEIPLNRFAESREIAMGALYLASEMGSYVNGINLPIDGGRLGCL